VKVLIPSPLRSCTGERREVEAGGATLGELLHDLDRRHPGIRFRMIDEQDAIPPPHAHFRQPGPGAQPGDAAAAVGRSNHFPGAQRRMIPSPEMRR